MATSLGANRYNRQRWEDSDFPILCQTCLGDNPYIRMTKEKYGKECKICDRPFTIFRWCPGARMRFKKTEVCQTCAKLKNICQTCLLDLEYGLPVQLRDHALGLKDDLPKSDVNKEYFTQNMERQIANTDGTVAVGTVGKSERASELLKKLARAAPYYKRNLPHICSFWVKGECKRGEECPYSLLLSQPNNSRHEKPTPADDPLSDQNIKDRYYGIDDPVAEKLLKRVQGNSDINLTPPEDKTVTTLYIGGCGENIDESDLKDYFYQFGEIRSIHLAAKQNCAFVQFSKRSDAELAASKTGGSLMLKDKRLVIRWGKSQGQRLESAKSSQSNEIELPPVPGLPDLPLPSDIQSGSSGQKRSADDNEPLPPGTFSGPPSGKQPLLPPPFGVPPMGMPPPMPMGMPPPNVPPPNFNGPPPPPPGVMPPPPPGIHYPSQDPQRMGTRAMK